MIRTLGYLESLSVDEEEEIMLYRITWLRDAEDIMLQRITVLRMFVKPFRISRVHCVKCLCLDSLIIVTVQHGLGHYGIQNHYPTLMRTFCYRASLSLVHDEDIMLYRITVL